MRRGVLWRRPGAAPPGRRAPHRAAGAVPAGAGPPAGLRGSLTGLLGAAALAGVVGGAGSAGGAMAAREPAERDGGLVIARSALSPGERLEVDGRDAEPGAIVTIHFAGPDGALVTTMAGPDGRYSASIEVPLSAGTGWHPVTAVSGGATLAASEIRVLGPSERAAAGAIRALPGIGLSTGLLALSIVVAAVLRRYRRQPVS